MFEIMLCITAAISLFIMVIEMAIEDYKNVAICGALFVPSMLMLYVLR